MAAAAAGLARRGHAVGWRERRPHGTAPPGVTPLHRWSDLWSFGADVVVSDAPDPLAPAFAGWQAGARCLVLELDHGTASRWGKAAQWAWHSLAPLGLVEPRQASDFQASPGGLDLERLALWSDVPVAREIEAAHPDTEILERACERTLARHRGRAPRPAVFVDRDGTLVREVGYLADPADLDVLPGAAEALRGLAAAGYALVVVSNQSGVGRGLFGIERVHEAMARLRAQLRAAGVELDGVYFCPHRPDQGCPCRKPAIGLLRRAAEDLHLGLSGSWMVGDKRIDVETGRRAGAGAILVRTGYGRDEEAARSDGDAVPDRVCDDLAEAAAWILARAPE